MRVSEVVSRRNVETGLVPEKWEAKQWCMKKKDGSKNDGENLDGEETRQPGLQCRRQSKKVSDSS